jgi:hypothetical protein
MHLVSLSRRPTLAEKKMGIFFNLKLFLILVIENLNSGCRNTAVSNCVGV